MLQARSRRGGGETAVETLLDKSQHKADAREVRRLIREGIEPVKGHGGDGGDEVCVTNSDQTDTTYLIARLKRDDPDLAQQVIDGQISPNADPAHDARSRPTRGPVTQWHDEPVCHYPDGLRGR